MKTIEFDFVITGVSGNIGSFEEKGEGAIKIDQNAFKTEGSLHSEMIKDALDTFIEVTQKSKKYENITELTVSVQNIKES